MYHCPVLAYEKDADVMGIGLLGMAAAEKGRGEVGYYLHLRNHCRARRL